MSIIHEICEYFGGWDLIDCDQFEALQALEGNFVEHINTHGLNYATKEEYKFRLNLFMETDAELKKINSDVENTFTVGHNLFSTMTLSEKAMRKGRLPQDSIPEDRVYEEVDYDLEANVDWRSRGAVNSVQDQGQCGSCWAFSTTAAVEAAHKIRSGSLLKLSESQLVDCDRGDSGCRGGMEDSAMTYLKSNAQELESDYRYSPRKNSCKYSRSKGKVNVTSFNYIRNTLSASAMKSSISRGPTCVGIFSGDRAFSHYTGGIFNVKSCSTRQDHAVTAVGYGSDYFLVRNSWGRSWGMSGYIKMSSTIGGKGVCGILENAVRPTTN